MRGVSTLNGIFARRALSARRLARAGLAAALLAPGAARAEIVLDHPWAPPTPPKAVVARAYVGIFNRSNEMDHLVAVRSDAAQSAEIAGIRILQDVPNLRRFNNIDIPANRGVTFAPGGFHVLLRNLKKPLAVGDRIAAELIFENAGAVPVVFVVEAPPAADR